MFVPLAPQAKLPWIMFVWNVLELSQRMYVLNALQAKLSQLLLKRVLIVSEMSQPMYALLALQAKFSILQLNFVKTV